MRAQIISYSNFNCGITVFTNMKEVGVNFSSYSLFKAKLSTLQLTAVPVTVRSTYTWSKL